MVTQRNGFQKKETQKMIKNGNIKMLTSNGKFKNCNKNGNIKWKHKKSPKIEQKLLKTILDIAFVEINFDATKARLIEDGFYPYEDRQIHAITNGEDPLDYYRFHISKYYFPKEEYWEELNQIKFI